MIWSNGELGKKNAREEESREEFLIGKAGPSHLSARNIVCMHNNIEPSESSHHHLASVYTYPLDPGQMAISQKTNGEGLVIKERDLPPNYVTDFKGEAVDTIKNESMMWLRAPKSFNPTNQELAIKTWLEKMDLFLELATYLEE